MQIYLIDLLAIRIGYFKEFQYVLSPKCILVSMVLGDGPGGRWLYGSWLLSKHMTWSHFALETSKTKSM